MNIDRALQRIGGGGSDAMYQARRVHYYPGDGLEYVFREWAIPYGMKVYMNNDPIWTNQLFGGVSGGPTIFYLESIRRGTTDLATFLYSRHTIEKLVGPIWADSTLGRALLTDIQGHQFENIHFDYGDIWMSLEAMGRSSTVWFNKVATNGHVTPAIPMPIAERGYPGSVAFHIAAQDEDDIPYMSYLGYVTKIVDPEGRATTFDYEPYTRIYTGHDFPTANVDSIVLTNFRLKQVVEPTTRQDIRYQRFDPIDGASTNIDAYDTAEIAASNTNRNPQFWLNNIARAVQKYDRNGALLSTDSFEIQFNYSTTRQKYVTNTKQTIRDEVTGLETVTSRNFARRLLPIFVPTQPQAYHTYVTVQYDSNADGTNVTSFGIDSIAPYLYETSVTTQAWKGQYGNAIDILQQNFTYTTEVCRDYDTGGVLTGYFGREIAKRMGVLTSLKPTVKTVNRDTTEYTNVAYYDTTFTRTIRILDKFATLDRYYAGRANGTITASWEDAMNDSNIAAVYQTVTDEYHMTMPPQYGIVRRQVLADSNGVIQTGKANRISLTNTDWDRLAWRGFVIGDSQMVRGGGTIPGKTYEYGFTYTPVEGLPVTITNSVGGRVDNSYSLPSGLPYARIALGDTSKILQNTDSVRMERIRDRSFSIYHGKPSLIGTRVRKYTASGTIDTMALHARQEITFFGQSSAVVDENGWKSTYDYDLNGRLLRAILPFDYQGADSNHVDTLTGWQSTEGYGWSDYITHHVQLDCRDNPPLEFDWQSAYDSTFLTPQLGIIVADNPTVVHDTCIACNSIKEKDDNRQLLQTCTNPIRDDYREASKGYITMTIKPGDVTQILSLDSVHLYLHVIALTGTCIDFRVTIDSLNFQQTYTFRCPNGGYQWRPEKKDDHELLISSGLSGDSLFSLDLTSKKTALMGLSGSAFTIRLEVLSSDDRVAIAGGLASADMRPKLRLKGSFQRNKSVHDYTLKYTYNDDSLKSTISAKIDDPRHTSNILGVYDGPRYTEASNWFGANYRVLKTEQPIGPLGSPIRVDSVMTAYTGLGAARRVKDQEGDTVLVEVDANARPTTTINTDATITRVKYTTGVPSSFGLSDEMFRGLVRIKTMTDERGFCRTEYRDVFDSLRLVVTDTAGMKLNTWYHYDGLGRISRVISPRGDTTKYYYDDQGHIQYKSHPDLGMISYRYDNLGNVRFIQSEDQAQHSRMTFNEYDDLNRLVLIGEAAFAVDSNYEDEVLGGCGNPGPHGNIPVGGDGGATAAQQGELKGGTIRFGKSGERGNHLLSSEDTTFSRTTDSINPHTLHTDTVTSYLTLNPTVLQTPLMSVPTFFTDSTMTKVTCTSFTNPILGEYDPPLSNFKVLHTAQQYRSKVGPAATLSDFEHVAKYPHFVRTAIYYDSLPPQLGAIWARFPRHGRWDTLAPTGKIRNLLGKQAAIAYREHGGEPFHYTVMSYDERGRLEAMIRFTENLGYDAVYYRYNSMNQLVEVKVEDPLNMHQSLYGYDWNGRVDSVWAVFSSGYGLHMGGSFKNPYYHATGNARKDTADIVYQYTKLGAVDTMRYPLVGVVVNYDYNRRKWLDSIVATKGGNALFMEVLGYDSSGQIIWQRYRHGTQGEARQDYLYDRINRLVGWFGTGMPDTMRYTYDAVGNRLTDSLTWKQGDYRYGQATGVGPNRLMRMVDSNVQTGLVLDSTRYTYDWDGATTRRIRVDLNAGTTVDEKFKYSYRDLLRRYTAGPGGTVIAQDWRYRYDPFGEREQKRMYYMGIDTLGAGYQHPWVYYLLGAQKQQLAVWHGMETCDPMCSDTGQRVYMYPVEYLTYGSGTAKVITQPDGTQVYKLSDHLGTSRAVVRSTGSTISETDYEPFGEPIPLTGNIPRLSYIDKESDFENRLADFGVRKYNSGRFISIDPKWEEYNQWSPYQYGANNPVRNVDRDGRDVVVLNDETAAGGLGHNSIIIGNDKDGWVYYSKDGENENTGEQEYPREKFATFGEFERSETGRRFQHGAWIQTDANTDARGQNFADRDVKTDYNGATNNCGDLVAKTLQSMGINVDGRQTVLTVTLPNVQMRAIVESGEVYKIYHFGHADDSKGGKPVWLKGLFEW